MDTVIPTPVADHPAPKKPTPKKNKEKTKSKARKQAKKKKVRASDQGAGGVVIGAKVKSQMMRIDYRLGSYIRAQAKRLTKETGRYHTATDVSRILYAKIKEVRLKSTEIPGMRLTA